MIEVGAGPGGLTRALLLEGAGHVIALERDDRCLPALETIAARHPGRLSIHMQDALEADWPKLVGGATSDIVIAANLPYNIATRLLDRVARDRAMAAVVVAHGPDVPERGGGAHRRCAIDQSLRPARGHLAVADATRA